MKELTVKAKFGSMLLLQVLMLARLSHGASTADCTRERCDECVKDLRRESDTGIAESTCSRQQHKSRETKKWKMRKKRKHQLH